MTEIRKAAKRALDLWGLESQVDMSIEELSELILALQKHFRRRSIDAQAVASEIADVEFMCDQLRCIIGDDLVDKEKEFKLSRLIRRMDEFERAVIQPVSQAVTLRQIQKTDGDEVVLQIRQKAAQRRNPVEVVVEPTLPGFDAQEYKTFEQWEAEGLHVKRGEKSHMKIAGKAVFARNQVVRREDERNNLKPLPSPLNAGFLLKDQDEPPF